MNNLSKHCKKSFEACIEDTNNSMKCAQRFNECQSLVEDCTDNTRNNNEIGKRLYKCEKRLKNIYNDSSWWKLWVIIGMFIGFISSSYVDRNRVIRIREAFNKSSSEMITNIIKK
jgi:hypothetical protein